MSLTQTRLVGLTFRATSPRYSDLQRTAAMSRTFPGRFNTASVGAVYVSREPETAIEELRRRVEHLRPGSRVEIVRTFELSRSMLRSIEDGASLANLLPGLRDLPLIAQMVTPDPSEPAE